ncbi:MAG: hypothetical protein K8T25_17325, partial [Planctomycetia bacterium]|nr:hypothetical protein [Planctomycetia bacterium]
DSSAEFGDPRPGIPNSGGRLLTTAEEGKLFRRLRTWLMLSTARQLWRTARLRLWLTTLLSLVFWGGLFALSHEGFVFLRSVTSQAEPIVFDLFYGSLMVMLTVSTAIILYGGLYNNRDMEYLLSTPTRAGRIFVVKFQEAVVMSSWGFILLGSPLLLAYGLAVNAPWYYYALLLPYMIAFACIPAGIGALGCLLIVQYLTRLRKVALIVLCLLVVGLAVLAGWSVISGGQNDLLTHHWFEHAVARLGKTQNRFLPSWWLRCGLMEAARNDGHSLSIQPWSQSLLFLALLTSNALLIHQVTVAVAERILAESYSRLHTVGSSVRRGGTAIVDRMLAVVLKPLPTTTRLLLLKDFRIFRRDPAQWTQFLIFLGLVLLFFTTVQWITYDKQYVLWINVVSFLNLGVVGLILSTFTTRFIYPLISLEGRRFWVLGPLPLSRDTILWGKFLFAALGSTLPCALLILLSDIVLSIAPLVILVHQLTNLLLCCGLSGIAVGLGAVMPAMRETNPSKIAAGFGGTLSLVLSALYIVVLVTLTAVPCYLYLDAVQRGAEAAAQANHWAWVVAAGLALAVAIGGMTTIVPMRLGLRAFRRLEF